MSKLTYREQLLHPNWQRKRLEVLNRDNFRCCMCEDDQTTLHVHHKQYAKGRLAWEYPNDELVTLYEVLYDQLHPWAQPYVRFARGQPWISFAGDVLPGSVVVARDPSGTAVGVVSLHGDPTCPLLAPTGVVAGTPRGRAVVTALVSAAVEWERDL